MLCDKLSVCYAFGGLRAGWNECKYVLYCDHESLWKTLSDRVKVMVKVWAGTDGWSISYCHKRHSIGFECKCGASHKDAEGYLSRYYEMLRIGNENALGPLVVPDLPNVHGKLGFKCK